MQSGSQLPEEKKIENSEREVNNSISDGRDFSRGQLSRKSLAGIIILTMFISSIFGASFGFISAGFFSVFSLKTTQQLEKIIPGFAGLKKIDPQVSKQQILIEDSAVIDVVKKSMPAVVSIVVSKDVPNIQSLNPFDQFFGGQLNPGNGQSNPPQGSQKQKVGGGSGFFISSDGLILTNRHVVEDQNATYTVIANDGKEYEAKVLARDPVRDIAVIRIEGNNFPTLSFGDSDSLEIGQTTIAIGNSLGEFANSVSRGIISGLKRNLNAGSGLGDSERLTDIVQTDAAINPGNSGGPLLDIQGRVIGVNVARAQGAENVAFALPINQAKRIIDQVKNGEKVTVPFLGVRYLNIDKTIQAEAKLPFDYGVLVLRGTKLTDLAVTPGSPADKADIVENDIILEVDNQKITQDNQLADIIAKHNVGDVLKIKLWHKGSTSEINLTLDALK